MSEHFNGRLLRADKIPSALSAAALARMRVPLVAHALGKCSRCGSTLVNDPLPHWCEPQERPQTRDHFWNERNAL